MIIDMDGFEIDLDKHFDAFAKLFKDMELDESDDQQVYNTVTVFIASIIASGLQDEYGDDPAKLEEQINSACEAIAEDREEKMKALLQ